MTLCAVLIAVLTVFITRISTCSWSLRTCCWSLLKRPCTRCGSRRRPRFFLQKVLSNPAYQRILLRTDTDTLLLYPPRTPCSTSLLSNSLVVHRASSCRSQTRDILACLQRTFTNPPVLVAMPDTPGFFSFKHILNLLSMVQNNALPCPERRLRPQRRILRSRLPEWLADR